MDIAVRYCSKTKFGNTSLESKVIMKVSDTVLLDMQLSLQRKQLQEKKITFTASDRDS
ncbi:hypothetical protein SAMN02910398_01356 [Butyrivibrio sp. YAB3001]|nr:hypothetical protein SAMN02910398_01356 [Butyrivibrio sp. YAB3001]